MSENSLERPGSSDEPIPGYRLIELLGRGGYGEVWKASAPGGVSKAIKLIFSDHPTHGMMELRALNRIKDVRHPFLMSIDRIEQLPNMLAIVMELGDANLQEHAQHYRDKGQPGIPQDELLTMLRDVADVLDFIYQEYALQHLDIKAANLLLFGKRLKVADFGLVKNIYERSSNLVQALTPAYAAPEIFSGKPSGTSDQYSLAIVYQEMLTGTLPFRETTPSRLAVQHLHETPDLRKLPAEHQPIIARALSKNPQQRFPSCTELIDELRSASRRARRHATEASEEFPLPGDVLNKPRTTSRPKLAPRPAPKTPERTENTSTAPEKLLTETIEPVQPPSGADLRPTLVIGLGGTAAQLLRQLRQRIGDRLGAVADVPAIKLLLIDTDPQTLYDVRSDQNQTNGMERVLAPLRSAADYRAQGQQHRRWISRRWLFNVPRNLQTGGLRPLGRLALLSNKSTVKSALRTAIQKIVAEKSSCIDGRRVNGPPRILLVASISGGAGSGMLLDVAYAARAELQRAGSVHGTVEGLLLHSTPVGSDRDKAILNAVATLRELNHYCQYGSFYPGEPLFEIPPFHGNNRTFSHARLLHLGQDLDEPQWLRSIDNAAEYVYARLTTPRQTFDAAENQHKPATAQDADPLLNVLQIRQVGGYAGGFLHDLSNQLCLDIIHGWCGWPAQSDSYQSSTQPGSLLKQTIREKDLHVRNQKFADDAALKVHEHGVELEQLVVRAREMLVQELAMNERRYLKLMIQEALDASAGPKSSDQEFTSFVLSLQDRTIGLDFGERSNDPSRNSLFDLLHSRLASQAMQLAAKFTNWVHELVDDSEAGVEAARLAADAGRSYVRDLTASLTKEIHAVHQQQTESRIRLVSQAQAAEPQKSSRWWRNSNKAYQQELVENGLIEHGLLCLEELVLVCVQMQLHAVEAQATAVIDKLLCFGHELKQFAQRYRDEQTTPEAAGAAGDAEMPPEGEQAVQQLLLEHRPRLVQELRRKIDQHVLSGPKKLQRFLDQPNSFDQQLGDPLLQHARQVVLNAMRQVLLILLRHGDSQRSATDINLDALLTEYLSEPWELGGNAPERTVVVVPDEASADPLERRLSAAGFPVHAVSAPSNNIAICREAAATDMNEIVQQIALHQPALIKLSENLHSRTDVTWEPIRQPQSHKPASDDAEPLPPADSDFADTLCLNQAKADA